MTPDEAQAPDRGVDDVLTTIDDVLASVDQEASTTSVGQAKSDELGASSDTGNITEAAAAPRERVNTPVPTEAAQAPQTRTGLPPGWSNDGWWPELFESQNADLDTNTGRLRRPLSFDPNAALIPAGPAHVPEVRDQKDVDEDDQGDNGEESVETEDDSDKAGEGKEELTGFRRFLAQTKSAFRGDDEEQDHELGEHNLAPETVIIVREPPSEDRNEAREATYAELAKREKERARADRRRNRILRDRALLVVRRWWLARYCSAAALGFGLGIKQAVALQMYAAAGKEIMALNPIITLATVPIVWTATKRTFNTTGRVLASSFIPATVGFYAIWAASMLSGQDLKAMLLANPHVNLYAPYATAGVITVFGLWLHYKTRRWWRPSSPGLFFCAPQWLFVHVPTASAVFAMLHFSTNR
ncbi:hypothetical protein [Streptomyces lydicus]|uniref:hypothetical protein n=1 Tax=Streptomyces lydicus TaxID=47763 RepID=UPI001010CBC2|nr:hypothetical protein [Streptomyces lydicus]MCZ1012094.1 hypothetical protein [Streptomyces lydicus]